MVGNRTDNLPHDKERRSRSHFLSKIRKQCSDHELPTCTACLKEWFQMYPTRVINQNNKFNPNNNVDGDFTNTNTTNNIGYSYGKKICH